MFIVNVITVNLQINIIEEKLSVRTRTCTTIDMETRKNIAIIFQLFFQIIIIYYLEKKYSRSCFSIESSYRDGSLVKHRNILDILFYMMKIWCFEDPHHCDFLLFLLASMARKEYAHVCSGLDFLTPCI